MAARNAALALIEEVVQGARGRLRESGKGVDVFRPSPEGAE